MTARQLTLALSKGRIFDESLPLLAEAGVRVLDDPETSRKLILATNQADVRVILVRATDVPTYAAVSALLLAAAFVACCVPARRAAGIDPQIALRCE